jgi:hypothetical protein
MHWNTIWNHASYKPVPNFLDSLMESSLRPNVITVRKAYRVNQKKRDVACSFTIELGLGSAEIGQKPMMYVQRLGLKT